MMNDEYRVGIIWWKVLFFSLLAGYCFYYAPYGINETDGGFLTGLAWQVLNGKVLYGDVIYVRPPLPVWLRAAELTLLPEPWAVLGERWLFYGKVALYAWFGASLLCAGTRRWVLATLGFVVSAHCYPAAAWHTVDGILCSVLGFWLLFRGTQIKSTGYVILAAAAIFASTLCKQSFYPLALLFIGLLIYLGDRRMAGWGIGFFLFCNVLFFSFLQWQGVLGNYLNLTGGAASGGQAFQHGMLDYFRIQPLLLALSFLLLLLVWGLLKNVARVIHFGKAISTVWALWIAILLGSYAYAIWRNQDFTAPFAQARLLFDLSAIFGIMALKKRFWTLDQGLRFVALMAVSWCASVSWGYNLPILFAVPWVFTTMEMSRLLNFSDSKKLKNIARATALVALLLVFRYGYEFIYRDGQRSQMTENMEQVFPQLRGIYSDTATFALYRDLKELSARYGPNFKTLPSFPQASYLCQAYPPLPLDWVVEREINSDHTLITSALQTKKPVLFLEKRFREQMQNDPELRLTLELFQQGKLIGETPHFWVLVDY